jgi:hypothetical protein
MILRDDPEHADAVGHPQAQRTLPPSLFISQPQEDAGADYPQRVSDQHTARFARNVPFSVDSQFFVKAGEAGELSIDPDEED